MTGEIFMELFDEYVTNKDYNLCVHKYIDSFLESDFYVEGYQDGIVISNFDGRKTLEMVIERSKYNLKFNIFYTNIIDKNNIYKHNLTIDFTQFGILIENYFWINNLLSQYKKEGYFDNKIKSYLDVTLSLNTDEIVSSREMIFFEDGTCISHVNDRKTRAMGKRFGVCSKMFVNEPYVFDCSSNFFDCEIEYANDISYLEYKLKLKKFNKEVKTRVLK